VPGWHNFLTQILAVSKEKGLKKGKKDEAFKNGLGRNSQVRTSVASPGGIVSDSARLKRVRDTIQPELEMVRGDLLLVLLLYSGVVLTHSRVFLEIMLSKANFRDGDKIKPV